MTTLRIEQPAPGVRLLTLARPDVMNALDMALAADLAAALARFAEDEDVRCLVLTGAGDRAFCAGNDIVEMGGMDAAAMMEAFVTRDPISWQIASHPKPVIAALNGVTYGAGALMAFAADIRFGCPATRIKVTATNYGAANATWSLPPIVGASKAKEILMSGRVVCGEEARDIGLLDQFVADAALTEAAVALAATIAANPAPGVQAIKRLVGDAAGRPAQDAYRAEFAWMVEATRRGGQAGADVFSGFLSRKSN